MAHFPTVVLVSLTAVYIVLGVIIGVFTLILIAVSVYFVSVYRK